MRCSRTLSRWVSQGWRWSSAVVSEVCTNLNLGYLSPRRGSVQKNEVAGRSLPIFAQLAVNRNYSDYFRESFANGRFGLDDREKSATIYKDVLRRPVSTGKLYYDVSAANELYLRH